MIQNSISDNRIVWLDVIRCVAIFVVMMSICPVMCGKGCTLPDGDILSVNLPLLFQFSS